MSMPRSIMVTVVGGGHVAEPSTNQIRAPAGSFVATGSGSEGRVSDPPSAAVQPATIRSEAIAMVTTRVGTLDPPRSATLLHPTDPALDLDEHRGCGLSGMGRGLAEPVDQSREGDMRRVPLMVFAVTLVVGSLATSVQASVPPTTAGHDARVTRQTYVRHDLGTDPTIQICNSTDPADYGNLTINNEPFSAVDPERPDLVISGWNDYCSDWMGLGFSTDGGDYLDELAGSRLPGRHVYGGQAVTGVRADQQRERPGRRLQPIRNEVLLRVHRVQRLRGEEDELRPRRRDLPCALHHGPDV